MLYVDSDDHSYQNFISPFDSTLVIVGCRQSMSACNQTCAKKSSGEILFFVNDDIIVETQGWDRDIRLVHTTSVDKIYLCYPNDNYKRHKLGVFPIISRFMFDQFDVLPVIYKGSFIDTHLHEIFRFLKRMGHDRIIYKDKIIFKHNHFRVSNSGFDETYKNRKRFADDLTFFLNVKNRDNTAKRLKIYIEENTLKNSNQYPKIYTTKFFNALMCYLFYNPETFKYRTKVLTMLILRLVYRIFSRNL